MLKMDNALYVGIHDTEMQLYILPIKRTSMHALHDTIAIVFGNGNVPGMRPNMDIVCMTYLNRTSHKHTVVSVVLVMFWL